MRHWFRTFQSCWMLFLWELVTRLLQTIHRFVEIVWTISGEMFAYSASLQKHHTFVLWYETGNNYSVARAARRYWSSRQYATLPQFEAYFYSPKFLAGPQPPNDKRWRWRALRSKIRSASVRQATSAPCCHQLSLRFYLGHTQYPFCLLYTSDAADE